MGAHQARKLRPMATVHPEVIRGRVATVKLSRRRYLKKRPRIAGFCTLCVPHHTQGSCRGDCNSALAAVHERNKQEKSLPKKAAQERTHKREDRHTRNNKEGSPKHYDQLAPGDQTGTKKNLESSRFPHFIRVAFCSRHPRGGADAQSR